MQEPVNGIDTEVELVVLLAVAGAAPDPVGRLEVVAPGTVGGVVPDVLACVAGVTVAADVVGAAEDVTTGDVEPVVDPLVEPVVDPLVVLPDELLGEDVLPPADVPPFPAVVFPPALPVLFTWLWVACGCLGAAVEGVDA